MINGQKVVCGWRCGWKGVASKLLECEIRRKDNGEFVEDIMLCPKCSCHEDIQRVCEHDGCMEPIVPTPDGYGSFCSEHFPIMHRARCGMRKSMALEYEKIKTELVAMLDYQQMLVDHDAMEAMYLDMRMDGESLEAWIARAACDWGVEFEERIGHRVRQYRLRSALGSYVRLSERGMDA